MSPSYRSELSWKQGKFLLPVCASRPERSLPISGTSALSPEKQAKSLELRGEPFEEPALVRLFGVAKTIVQAVRPALPEFDAGGREHISAPVRGPGNLRTGVLLLTLAPGFLQHGAVAM